MVGRKAINVILLVACLAVGFGSTNPISIHLQVSSHGQLQLHNSMAGVKRTNVNILEVLRHSKH